tara:strand:+ start:14920 stop:16185 length:1266 start_codon:yes stop_codon:yes gene_type:complete
MYWLIEDVEQLKVFYNSGYKEAFVEVIPYNNFQHPIENKVSAIYIRPLSSSKGYIIASEHSEAIGIKLDHIEAVLKKFDVLYCRDKKEILHYFPLKSFYDINQPPNTYIRPTTDTHEIFYSNHRDYTANNVIIPIVKHYELCEQIFNELKDNIGKNTDYGSFFNSRVSLVFNAIERCGLRVHIPRFEGFFHPIDSERVYTQYNLKTLTTRPSNRFRGVNYAALNKDNGSRKAFIPRNDKFIEIDITAYHPTIASRLVEYQFDDVDVHTSFAKMYNVDRNKAKELTFKQLYGGIFKEYEHLEFFKRIKKYIEQKWLEFNTNGYVECEISKYRFYKDKLDNMNPQKLFNYLLQNYETSQNILIIWDILSMLRGKKSKLVLYTYDSFLIDFCEEEQDLVQDMEKIFEKYNLNTNNKQGYDYDFR